MSQPVSLNGRSDQAIVALGNGDRLMLEIKYATRDYHATILGQPELLRDIG